jgi:hypothetical protein
MARLSILDFIQGGARAGCHKKQHVKDQVPNDPRGTSYSNGSSETVI